MLAMTATTVVPTTQHHVSDGPATALMTASASGRQGARGSWSRGWIWNGSRWDWPRVREVARVTLSKRYHAGAYWRPETANERRFRMFMLTTIVLRASRSGRDRLLRQRRRPRRNVFCAVG